MKVLNLHLDVVLLHEQQPYRKIKEKKWGTEGAYSSEPQKAHPTSEFILVSKNDGRALFCVAGSSEWVSEADEILSFDGLKKIQYPSTWKFFLVKCYI